MKKLVFLLIAVMMVAAATTSSAGSVYCSSTSQAGTEYKTYDDYSTISGTVSLYYYLHIETEFQGDGYARAQLWSGALYKIIEGDTDEHITGGGFGTQSVTVVAETWPPDEGYIYTYVGASW